jgi:hypothetical protein
MPQDRKPGDVFLNRYMPGASEEEREEARENLYRFAAVLARIAGRRGLEEYEQAIRAKNEVGVKYGHGSPPPS